MRFHGVIEEVLGSPKKIRLLKIFLRYPAKQFTGREAARLAGLSAPGAWRIMKSFESHGLLKRVRVGRSDAWQLQEQHILVEKLGKLRFIEEEAIEALKKLVLEHLKGLKVKKIVLFGSVARGNERRDSDVDLLVVVGSERDKKLAEKRVLDAAMDAYNLLGNQLAAIVYSEKEFGRKRDSSLIKNIEKEGRALYSSD